MVRGLRSLGDMVTDDNPFFNHHVSFLRTTRCNVSKPKHLKHFLHELFVGDLGVEVGRLECLGL